ncbi:lipase secretion chaperone [Pseudoteredinibacter isoporae]|uniref:lipase secretion chaperone n=1 Tax=Pseudoteredinibacter isoporae TaxID=570281 RepID=UPI003106A615
MRKLLYFLVPILFIAAGLWYQNFHPGFGQDEVVLGASVEEAALRKQQGEDRLYDLERPKVNPQQDHSPLVQRELEIYLEDNPLPKSMMGTEINGRLRFDEQANLINEYANRSLFDQLLSLQGEWSLSKIKTWLFDFALIAAEHTGTPQVGAEQVMQAFERYLSYLKAADALYSESVSSAPEFSGDSFSELYQLRRSILGEEVADVYFAGEEAYTKGQLELAEIRKDDRLSDKERLRKLNEWSASQSTYTAQAMREKARRDDLRSKVEQMRQSGASSEEIFSVRAQEFGVEAAERLASMDVARESWQGTVDSFRDEVTRIRQSGSTDEAKNQMIDDLLSNYEAAEQRRLRALVL